MMKLTVVKMILWCVAIGLFTVFLPKKGLDQTMTLNALIKQLDGVGKQYIAVSNGDTALLSITHDGVAIKGNLRFKFAKGNTTVGLIKGTFTGDTLSGDYLFKTEQGRWYRNPVALLKTGMQLTMGVGEMEFAWGRAYFKKGEAIDYDKGRFIFVETKGRLAANYF